MRSPLTKEDYFAARMISEPFCLFDYCLECDGAVAVVTTSSERARDLRQPPVYVTASAQGGAGSWGQSITWMGMPDEIFASSGHRPVARDLFRRAGLGPADVDVALIYDHFTGMVLMQLEDYGFCPLASLALSWRTGTSATSVGRSPSIHTAETCRMPTSSGSRTSSKASNSFAARGSTRSPTPRLLS